AAGAARSVTVSVLALAVVTVLAGVALAPARGGRDGRALRAGRAAGGVGERGDRRAVAVALGGGVPAVLAERVAAVPPGVTAAVACRRRDLGALGGARRRRRAGERRHGRAVSLRRGGAGMGL